MRSPETDPRSKEEPWEGYDSDTVSVVVEAVEVWHDEKNTAGIESVVIYELAHRRRPRVVEVAELSLKRPPSSPGSWLGWIGLVVTRPPQHHAMVRLVHLTLALHADADGRCNPSVIRLAEQAGCSERQARRCIGELVKLGYLRRKSETRPTGARASNQYTLLWPQRQRPRTAPTGQGVSAPTGPPDSPDRVARTAPTGTPRTARAGKQPEQERSGEPSSNEVPRSAGRHDDAPPAGRTSSVDRSAQSSDSDSSPSTSSTLSGGPDSADRAVSADTTPAIRRFLQQRRAQSSQIPAGTNGHG